MIPKIIHYVWLGDKELPEPDRTYVEGWKKLLPDWEIKCWGLEAIKDLDDPFLKETLSVRSWVFASDWIRLYALATEGGFYLDTDVELKSTLEPFRSHDLCFGLNRNLHPQTAVLGSVPHQPLIEELLETYSKRKFIKGDGVYDVTASNTVYRRMFLRHGVDLEKLSPEQQHDVLPGVRIYPTAVLCRPCGDPAVNVAHHHVKGTWVAPYERKQVIDLPFGYRLIRIKRRGRAKAEDALPLLAHEKRCFALRFRQKVLVFAKVVE